MILPRGATGFWDASAEPPPACDVTAFRAAGYAIAREVGGTVESFTPARQTPNFHLLVLDTGTRTGIACHALLPWLALVQPPLPSSAEPLSFLSCPRLGDRLEQFPPFRLLRHSELVLPLDQADLTALARAELAQIRYWRPHYVGELLFNWWD